MLSILLPIDSFKCEINIQDLISIDKAMTETKLGPNGAFLYCMNYLEVHIDWLFQQIEKYSEGL